MVIVTLYITFGLKHCNWLATVRLWEEQVPDLSDPSISFVFWGKTLYFHSDFLLKRMNRTKRYVLIFREKYVGKQPTLSYGECVIPNHGTNLQCWSKLALWITWDKMTSRSVTIVIVSEAYRKSRKLPPTSMRYYLTNVYFEISSMGLESEGYLFLKIFTNGWQNFEQHLV